MHWSGTVLWVAFTQAVSTALVTVPLTRSEDGLHFLMALELGTPNQTLNVIVDTGSSEFSVFEEATLCGTSTPCFNPAASSSITALPGLDGGLALLVDGETVSSSGSTVASDVASMIPGGHPVRVTFSLINRLVISDPIPGAPLQALHRAQGLLGLAYESIATLSCPGRANASCTPFERLAGFTGMSYRPLVSIDLGGPAPQLLIGDVPGARAPPVQWSDRIPYSRPFFHHFTIHSLSVCGVSMFANYTQHWDAIVDTGASCLSLPGEFFDTVMAWIPSSCDAPVHVNGQYGSMMYQTCYVNETVVNLPSLSFTVTNGGDPIYLPIQNLLLPSSGGRRRICMFRDIDAFSSTAVQLRPISFGALAMTALFASFDMSSAQRVGLANQPGINGTGANDNCKAPAPCIGQQTYWAPLNACQDPDCSNYLVMGLDPATRQCTFDQAAAITVYAIVTALFVAEVGLQAFYRQQCHRVKRSISSQ
ncbi:unnamed protein product (mitochondrion) [Plasmodiophora brassicae]|uniref:Peptidase A1 domain-containing protein n=1 Tax=Plasmodiophora brassicae TaxID=37360 RepID=A0A0G4J090_PLABS|nr:hypothetical protein PBRA_001745 [Plasmodiophora brassicae]SPQ93825.1 unnamed protein product [Plasmodiophora brassicae]